jgi:CubicO group peptidase (beta-lactamase class C family)
MKNLLIQLARIISILGLCMISSCSQKDRDQFLSERVDSLFAEWNNLNSPGCALTVIQNGGIIYKNGYGMADLEHNIPITSGTVFYLGSVSKQFVAMCLLLLEDEGKLSLDDNVRKYLPEFPKNDTPITIRNLIYHTSGIPDFETIWDIEGRDALNCISENEVYKLICSWKKLDFTPGEKQQYSNSGYFLAGLIIRKVSGKSLKDYSEEKIFNPLGMRNSQFLDDNTNIIKNRAFGYGPLLYGGFGNAIMRYDLVGPGGLYSNVEDLYLWDQNFYHNKLGKGGQDLINKMLTKGKLNNGSELNYACGQFFGNYRGTKTIQHSGAFGGYRSCFIRFPDKKLSVIILSNIAGFREREIAFEVADRFLK